MKLKNKAFKILCLLCAAGLAFGAGCTVTKEGVSESASEEESGQLPEATDAEPPESGTPVKYDRENPYPWVAPTDFQSDLERRAAEIADDAIELACRVVLTYPVTVIDGPATPFWRGRRDTLREYSQEWYDFLYEKARNFEDYALDEAALDTKKQDIFDTQNSLFSLVTTAEEALKKDYPEIEAYFTNETGSIYRPQYYIRKSLYDEPDGDVEKAKEEFALLEAVADRIIRCMPEGLSLYDKYRYLCIVVDELCEYDHDNTLITATFTSVYNALIEGTGVCRDYASTFRYLCAKADLWCEYVTGILSYRIVDGEPMHHAWVAVKLGDEIYYIDPTFQDTCDPYTYNWHDYTFMFTQNYAEDMDHYAETWTLGPFTPESISNLELVPADERYHW